MVVLSVQVMAPDVLPLGSPLPVQDVAPMIFTGSVADTTDVHVAEPDETFIVSPDDAPVMQDCRLEESGVLVHVGLEPAHAPYSDEETKMRTASFIEDAFRSGRSSGSRNTGKSQKSECWGLRHQNELAPSVH